MVYVPPGEFDLGCGKNDSDCYSDEKPAKHIKITYGFCMDKHEVTQGEYEKVTGGNPSRFKACGPDCPVEGVTVMNAQLYCAHSMKTLPTEAQWEYAARAGANTKYYWGDAFSEDYAWYDRNSQVSYKGGIKGSGTHQVGQKKPNDFGLYDMTGNVWEWVQDCYAPNAYATMSDHDPVNFNGSCPGNGIRGGSWAMTPWYQRVSFRYWVKGNDAGMIGTIGFRCIFEEDMMEQLLKEYNAILKAAEKEKQKVK
jgi:formylglycine-generating enzyme